LPPYPSRVCKKPLEDGVNSFNLFIDFSVVCDTINREKILEVMNEFKIPRKSIGLVRANLKHVTCRVKIQNNLREPLGTPVGQRQGGAL
jgi:hypothetical protein